MLDQHINELYLIYGISFLFLAAAIYLQPHDKAVLSFGTELNWLARFGSVHGLKELMDWWALFYAEPNALFMSGNLLLLAVSYYALFEFARRFWDKLGKESGKLWSWPSKVRVLAIISILLAGALSVSNHYHAATFSAGIRYFLGFPAAVLAGFAFLLYERRNRAYLRKIQLDGAIKLCAGAFLAYSVFAGLTGEYTPLFAHALLNTASFQALTGVPVQLPRALCALLIALAIAIVLYRVNAEKQRKEQQALKQLGEINSKLENLVIERTRKLERINDSLRREIEDRHKAEQALRCSQENLERAQSVAHIGSWYIDLTDNSLSWSPETYRIFNLPQGLPIEYHKLLKLVHPDDRDKVDEAWQAALRGNEYDIEHRIVFGNAVKWVRERAELEFDQDGNLHAGIGTVQDITELKQSELNLQQTLLDLKASEHRQRELRILAESEQSRMAALLSAMSIGILFEDRTGKVEYVNLAFRRMWALEDRENPVGKSTQFVLENSTHRFARPDHASKYVLKVLDTHEISERFEIDLYDGRILTQISYPVTDIDGRIIGRLWIYEDITQERQTAQQLLYLAEHDALTGLYNRHRFQEQLGHMISASRRRGGQFALIYFDLDEFKYINDHFGHRAGDTVLVRIAAELAVVVREVEIFARLGGDEFAILCLYLPKDDISVLPNRIGRSVASIPFRFRGTNIRLTASIGVAIFPEHGETVEDLVAHADTAMYQAKNQGKNTWALYDPSRDQAGAIMERMTWRRRIDQALQENLLELHFQGIFRIENLSLSHFEVLVRMRDPQHLDHLIMPGQFIPIAENSGQILEIDRWVLSESIRLLAEHPEIPSLAINVSGRSFDDPELPKFIRDQLQSNMVNPNRLLIELTETEALSDIQEAQRFIESIRQAGCSVCLDDFGSGFSTFAYLKYLEVDILKIDGMFIRDLPNNHENQVFVKAMAGIAKGLHKIILAEFVEDAGTLQMLNDLGIHLAQGYHLARPTANYQSLIESAAVSSKGSSGALPENTR
ncbi:MAG: sensor domain-containing protein [Gammaproteobacteria bacterium]